MAKPGSHPPTHTHTHSYQGFCMADVAKTSISNSNSHKFKRLSLSFEGKQKGLAKKSMRLKRTASCSAFHTAVAFSNSTHKKKDFNRISNLGKKPSISVYPYISKKVFVLNLLI